MIQARRPVYFERFKKHVEDLEKHLNEGDYLQAAEKVWGAISSFVNAFHHEEVTSAKAKKAVFARLYHELASEDKLLDSVLKENFRRISEFISKAEALHRHFYGGCDYTENQLIDTITRCAKILKNIYGKVISKP
jgi:glycyl-tRNA synthetase beta subunit